MIYKFVNIKWIFICTNFITKPCLNVGIGYPAEPLIAVRPVFSFCVKLEKRRDLLPGRTI